MKKIYGAMMAIAVAAMSFVSCNITPEPEPLEEEVTYHTVTFTALADVDSKAQVVEGATSASYVWDESDLERFHVFENGTEATGENLTVSLSSDNKTVSITARFPNTNRAPYEYTAYVADVYDGNAYITDSQSVGHDVYNFDPSADVLVADPVSSNELLTELQFRFKRVVSVNKVTLKGLPVGYKVNTVCIYSDNPFPTYYNIASGTYLGEAEYIDVNQGAKVVGSDGTMPIYFVAAPVEETHIKIKVDMDDLDGYPVLYGKAFNTPVTFACGTMFRFGANLEGCEIDEFWRKAQNMYFENPGPFTVYADDSETFTLPRLIGAQTSPVDYFSSNSDVAHFNDDDPTDNTLYIAGPGTTTIIASVPDSEDYMEGYASFELIVLEGSSENAPRFNIHDSYDIVQIDNNNALLKIDYYEDSYQYYIFIDTENVTESITVSVDEEVVTNATLYVYSTGHYNVTFSNSENNTIDVREGYISLSANGATFTIKVLQYPYVDGFGEPDDPFTVSDAMAVINATDPEMLSTTEFYVWGIVSGEVVVNNGTATYSIMDPDYPDRMLSVPSGKYLEGADFTSEDQLKPGDKVIVCGYLSGANIAYQFEVGSSVYDIYRPIGVDRSFNFTVSLQDWPTEPDHDSATYSFPLESMYSEGITVSGDVNFYLSSGVYQMTDDDEVVGLYVPAGGCIGLPAIPDFRLDYIDLYSVEDSSDVTVSVSSSAQRIIPVVMDDRFYAYNYWKYIPSSEGPGIVYYLYFDKECVLSKLYLSYYQYSDYTSTVPTIGGDQVHNDNDNWR